MQPEISALEPIFHKLFKFPFDDLYNCNTKWSRRAKKKAAKGTKKEPVNYGDSILLRPVVKLSSNFSRTALLINLQEVICSTSVHKRNKLYFNSCNDFPTEEFNAEPNESDTSDEVATVPKIVGAGLKCMTELIKECQATDSNICLRTLEALFDVLQGQTPQGLRHEPKELLDSLFDVLMDLAVYYDPDEKIVDNGKHLSAVACSCLFSLIVAIGSNEKILAAASSILMTQKPLEVQNMQLPLILNVFQKSIQIVLLGKFSYPEWITHGLLNNSEIESFELDYSEVFGNVRSFAADGQFLYFYTSKGLFKIGSGYNGTVKGCLYDSMSDIFRDDEAWIGYASESLWVKLSQKRGNELLRIDKDCFHVLEVIKIDIKKSGPGLWFSDGNQLGVISIFNKDSIVIKTLNCNIRPIEFNEERTVKFTKKYIRIYGVASYDSLKFLRHSDEISNEIAAVAAGKEFGLYRTSNGQVFYSGNASSLGLKRTKYSRYWNELTIQGAKIKHIAVGHEGLHGVIVTDNGAAFFCGTARRGEDGDTSKTRRQPKAVKPKKITKVEHEIIVHAAANNGTTALVTKDGRLLMFGKDTAHCNTTTGLVDELKDVRVKQVALGKAHAVALTADGTVYTFGINNKGQCGREFTEQLKENPPLATESENIILEEEEFDPEETCSSGKHIFRYSQCLVCTLCRSCTGNGKSCSSTKNPEKNPGQECGCGEGDSGCAICGCCRTCATEDIDNSEMALLSSPGGDIVEMMRLDLMYGNENQDGKDAAKLQDQMQKRLEERRQKQTKRIVPKNFSDSKVKSSGARSNLSQDAPQPSNSRTPSKFSNLISEEQTLANDVEKDPSRIVSLPPAPIELECTSPIVQIACGLHHTVILSKSGEVFTFGSNTYGQLGVGDILLRGGPLKVSIPEPAQSIAAGSNHTVILTVMGKVFTFGSNKGNQLGRNDSKAESVSHNRLGGSETFYDDYAWHTVPGPIPDLGPHHEQKAIWIGAAGDETYLTISENLINSLELKRSKVIANAKSFFILPNNSCKNIDTLAINRESGLYSIFCARKYLRASDSFFYLDPVFDVIWRYRPNSRTVSCHNIVGSQVKPRDNLVSSMFHSSMMLPMKSGVLVKESQVALYLLGALEVLLETRNEEMKLGDKACRLKSVKGCNVQEFLVVNRFDNNGGGWGYSGHSVEAIRFMVDTDIILGGFGLFGGRGEYSARIRLLDIGVDGGDHESSGDVIAEVDDTPFECGPRQKFAMMFKEPVFIHAKRWYVAWARISGPSSDCGSNGLSVVVTEDQVTFHFKSSKKSNNGTDVNAGQIPELFYRHVIKEMSPRSSQAFLNESLYILTKEFSSKATKSCFQTLINLLEWSWTTLKAECENISSSASIESYYSDCELVTQLVRISRICLRLIYHYVNEIYPTEYTKKKLIPESAELADCIGDIRALLRQILSEKLTPGSYKMYLDNVVAEGHKTFLLLFHVMYPTNLMKWNCLCDLLSEVDKCGLDYIKRDTLLSAVVGSLYVQKTHLLFMLPILDLSQSHFNLINNLGLTMSKAGHYFPVLVEKMASRMLHDVESKTIVTLDWCDVQQRLLNIIVYPLQKALFKEASNIKDDLVIYCSFLLYRIISELCVLPKSFEDNLKSTCGRVLHKTPSRFMRTNHTRTWNSGKGSPDAICFSVDKPGIVIVGACIYGGTGVYEYELELLEDQNKTKLDSAPAQRWTTLEIAKGTFGPEDCVSDVAELKFDKMVPIRENVKYAIRFRNQGGRTSNGDGGLTTVRGPDGTSFTFVTCSLSFNGTTQTRGQIPSILYYSHPQDNDSQQAAQAIIKKEAQRNALSIITNIFRKGSFIFSLARELAKDMDTIKMLSNSHFVKLMLSLTVVPAGILVTDDLQCNVQVLSAIQEILPHVTALNSLNLNENNELRKTTSNYYIWVESEHPYKQASVSNYRVSFPNSINFLAVEFASGCGTIQSEDILKLFIRTKTESNSENVTLLTQEEGWTNSEIGPEWCEAYRLCGGSTWSQQTVFLQGNEVLFSLETATNYIKDEKSCSYGFRCLVIGYDIPFNNSVQLSNLESLMAYLGGKCAAYLIKKDLDLPPTTVEEMKENVEHAEETAMLVASEHPLLLMNGLALTHNPTISQALNGVLPLRCCSIERRFLQDLVNCTPDSSGGRLASWLQPNSYIDPGKCEILCNQNEFKCDSPATFTIVTRDQYSEKAQAPNLKIEAYAIPIEEDEADKGRKVHGLNDERSRAAVLVPGNASNLSIPYESTTNKNVRYHSITIMENYKQFCFEELRHMRPNKKNQEPMLVKSNGDGTYSVTWHPVNNGLYSIMVSIDGYPLSEVCKVQEKQIYQNIRTPTPVLLEKEIQKPTKLRKFITENSAGIRIRSHPSLQSEQIGIVPVGGVIAFIDEFHNDDGVWLRLDRNTIKQYSSIENNSKTEGWCLQYNQHFGKTFLHPVEEPKTILTQTVDDTNKKKNEVIPKEKSVIFHKMKNFIVVDCGASGHNIRNQPNLNAPSVGVLLKGDQVEVSEQLVNLEGNWVKLSPEAKDLYCFEVKTDEAWALASTPTELFMSDSSTRYSSRRGYDFTKLRSTSAEPSTSGYGFSSKAVDQVDPFIFGSSSPNLQVDNAVEVTASLDDDSYGLPIEIPHSRQYYNEQFLSRSALSAGHYMKEFIKTREGRAKNFCETLGIDSALGGSTRRLRSPRSRSSSPKSTRNEMWMTGHESHLSVVVPGLEAELSSGFFSPRTIPERKDWYSWSSSQSDISTHDSSFTRDLSPLSRDMPFRLSMSPLNSSPVKKDFHNDEELVHKERNADATESAKVAIHTTNESAATIKKHFSIGSGGKESPKPIRKDKSLIRNGNKIHSPAHSQNITSSPEKRLNIDKKTVKEAISPSLAESLRAIFAAFLWQEGIVHDAMACASFLKFHPSLSKQGTPAVTRRASSPKTTTKEDLSREQKQFQRHSVDVSISGDYLHIQPSTLESLKRSAANANANRTRKKNQSQQPERSIKEETSTDSNKDTTQNENLNKIKVDENKKNGNDDTVSVLPLALKGLVCIWDELTNVCCRSIDQQPLPASPLKIQEKVTTNVKDPDTGKEKFENKKKKEFKSTENIENLDEAGAQTENNKEEFCELCGHNYSLPITEHLKISHPGCGRDGMGKFYNTDGDYLILTGDRCGKPKQKDSTWYFLCDSCRIKYRTARMYVNDKRKDLKETSLTDIGNDYMESPALDSYKNSKIDHLVMKENAMFLLDLASSGMLNRQSRTVTEMPPASEQCDIPEEYSLFPPLTSFQCFPALKSNLQEEELNEILMRRTPHESDFPFNGNFQLNAESSTESQVIDNNNENQKGKLFHRSVSIGTSVTSLSKKDSESNKSVSSRRRNNSSSGEINLEGESSLLCRPSVTLQKLIPCLDESVVINSQERIALDFQNRPSIAFILRRHPLKALRLAMNQSLRKATCRLYAFQALNWLLRTVTQPVSLHDLLWWFVEALTPRQSNSFENGELPVEQLRTEPINICQHPLSDIVFAGDAAFPLWKAFHQFLQAVADLMLFLPPSSPLQTMAVRCWGLKFSQIDHVFLHRSQVFNNISKILSRSEEETDEASANVQENQEDRDLQYLGTTAEQLRDLTPVVKIKVSSRPAMVGSLTDNSTETFWESGDEDRNKNKVITIICEAFSLPEIIFIHVDNCRDLANKVTSVCFFSGWNVEEMSKIDLVEVESRYTGWISSRIPQNHNILRLELKGPDNSLRVRQICVLGHLEKRLVIPQESPAKIQQSLCEMETLKVFRLLTSQVFGKLVLGENTNQTKREYEEQIEENNDLKEHMVGILFSGSKLTHLQKQICMHIVHAIRKEATKVREEWESFLCSPLPLSDIKPSDTYAFEMLSMVLALSGSSVGRQYLSHQYGLLTDLLSLLHTGSARVQRQITALLRRVLPEVSPFALGNVLGVGHFPPSDFSIASLGLDQCSSFDPHQIGILDVFLSVVAKVLNVQVKVKGKDGKESTTVTLATAIHPKDQVGQRWWLRGSISRKLAEDIIILLNDMASGKLSEAWGNITKGAIAENILNLTRLKENQREPTECLKTPTLWLALASLCVLDKDHVERLSARQWNGAEGQQSLSRPTCTNHDDNETHAIVQCNTCGNLCAECDKYLHLNKRTRLHQRQVCKEEEEVIKVDLHEGCGRMKIFWVMALADSSTLKAMVEFRERSKNKSSTVSVGVCRFCSATGNSGLLAIGNVCGNDDCQEHARNACAKVHPCGHACGGLYNESNCLPCLYGCGTIEKLKQDADDMCMICFTEALSYAPAIQLFCGHVFHFHCTRNVLMKGWAGPRITFSFAQCPICKSPIEHPVLQELLQPVKELYEDVKRKALMRLEYEGLDKAVPITSPGAKFFNDPSSYAMDRYAYYVCFKCKKAYYGGEARCDAEMNGDYDPSELVCGGCSDVARAQMCSKHGTDFLEYKCRYCCSVAVFFCFGTTHFCNSCHEDFQRVTNVPKVELPKCPAGPKGKQLDGKECPLHVTHPTTGEEFALGCGVCRNAHTF